MTLLRQFSRQKVKSGAELMRYADSRACLVDPGGRGLDVDCNLIAHQIGWHLAFQLVHPQIHGAIGKALNDHRQPSAVLAEQAQHFVEPAHSAQQPVEVAWYFGSSELTGFEGCGWRPP